MALECHIGKHQKTVDLYFLTCAECLEYLLTKANSS
jgi:hypothetical protein